MRKVDRDERGISLVIVALSMVAILAVIGLFLDGGAGFSDKRQTQNGADAAALAGTRVIQQWIQSNYNGATAGTVVAAVTAKASQNNTNQSPHCWFIDQTYSHAYANSFQSGPAPQVLANGGGYAVAIDGSNECSSFSAIPANADGVLVKTADQQNTAFERAAGIQQLTVRSRAAAQVERNLPGNGAQVLMMCATDSLVINSDGSTSTSPILIQTGQGKWIIDTTKAWPANDEPFMVRDPSAPDCGLGSSFKGWVSGAKKAREDNNCPPGQMPQQYQLPGPWPPEHGDLGGSTTCVIQYNALNGPSCSLDPPSSPPTQAQLNALCQMQVPLCHTLNSSNLTCEGFAVFAIYDPGPASIYDGYLLSTSLIVPSGGAGGTPSPTDSSVVRLVQ